MDKKVINKYFREFLITHKDVISYDEHSASIIKEIEKNIDVNFDKNWNNLMVLVLIIESYYQILNIQTHDNYVGFTFEDCTIQDKGFTKFDAYYFVCFKSLLKYWTEGKTTEVYINMEPFDEYDLK